MCQAVLLILYQGIMGLAALSYILRLDGKNSTADKYDKLNKGYISYWISKALVRLIKYSNTNF